VAKDASKHSREFVRIRQLTKAAEKAGVVVAAWSDDEFRQVGFPLLGAVQEATGAICRQKLNQGGKKKSYVMEFTDEVKGEVDAIHEMASVLRPGRRAMLIPPRPWTNAEDGGFLVPHESRGAVRGSTGEVEEFFSDGAGALTLDAVNIAQGTPWRVNKAVLAVLEALVEAGDEEMLPLTYDLDITPVPDYLLEALEAGTMTEEQDKEFRTACALKREDGRRRAQERSKLHALNRAVAEARELKDEEAFWLPYNLDFRGRIYPLVANLSPQGNEFERGMLEYAEGRPLGESGAYSVAVHTANCFGQDKLSLDDRVQWTMDNSDKLMESAMFPLAKDAFWRTAEKKERWIALACCFEWLALQIEGVDHVSYLVTTVDAKCSGIQHYSAILGDQEGAEAVSMVKVDKPTDIYSDVAAVCNRMIANEESPAATKAKESWNGLVERKHVKQPTMTTAYNCSAFGKRDQIADAITHVTDPRDKDALATQLEPVVTLAIAEVITKAVDGMEYLKQLAKIVAKSGQHISWLTPLGFPVIQKYEKINDSRAVKTWYAGTCFRHYPQTRVKGSVCTGKHVNGIAANFVHSMDATHLMMVVRRMHDEGFKDFWLVHDSIGCHAADMGELHQVLREEFVYLYGDDMDWLADFEEQVLASLGECEAADEIRNSKELKELRRKGTFDVHAVMEAEYFFA
jgi:DNA-directed RNA polymerase